MARQQARIANGRSFVWASVLRRDGGPRKTQRQQPFGLRWQQTAIIRQPKINWAIAVTRAKALNVTIHRRQRGSAGRRIRAMHRLSAIWGRAIKTAPACPDTAQAVKWYSLAAQQGSADAKQRLEALEKNSSPNKPKAPEQPPVSEKTAEQWYKAYLDEKDEEKRTAYLVRAAAMGCAPAQNQLGYCYDSGTGVPRDPAQATSWYRKAADRLCHGPVQPGQ